MQWLVWLHLEMQHPFESLMLVRGDQGHGWQNSVEHFRPHISFGVLERQGKSEAVCEEAVSSLPGKKNQSVSQEWRSSMILQGRGPEYVIQNKLSSAYQLRRPGKPKRPRVARRPCPSVRGEAQKVSQERLSSMIFQGRGPEYVNQNKVSSAYQLRRPGKTKRI